MEGLTLFMVCELCCVACFMAGYIVAKNGIKKAKVSEIDEKQKKELERANKDYQNFLKYDGTEQE